VHTIGTFCSGHGPQPDTDAIGTIVSTIGAATVRIGGESIALGRLSPVIPG
jgi:hypothetical protein